MLPPTRIAIFNVKYSPNLGDGIIAECLEFALKSQLPGASVFSLDLAGRKNWASEGEGRSRALKLALLDRMPRWLRDLSITAMIGQKLYRHLLPQWRSALKNADFVVFGGGQLIQDGNLNFPLKLAAAARECRARSLPTAVFGVGAAKITSRFGRKLISSLVSSPGSFHIAARDKQSAANLSALGCTPVLCRDPGLLASKLWPASPRSPRVRPLVGVCITHPAVLSHHADKHSGKKEPNALELYRTMISQLVSNGYDVLCFTNGAFEDELFVPSVVKGLGGGKGAGGSVRVAARSRNPRELAQLIGSLDTVIAHRLHATIVAYSYGVPAIGFQWDSKLDAFFESVRFDDHVMAFNADTVKTIASRVHSAIKRGVSPIFRDQVLSETSAGIKALTDAMTDRSRKIVTRHQLAHGGYEIRSAYSGASPAP